MLDPVINTIEVPCSQEKAFGIFVNEIDTWWPKEKFTTSAIAGFPAKEIRIEPKKGGKIIEIGPDDQENLWGTVISFDPFGFFSMDFHIPIPKEKVNSRSLVEVKFTVLGDELTQVELKQSNWEAFGRRAEMMRGGYGSGWTKIFEQAYKEACGK